VSTHVTRVVVTQTDEPPSPDDFAVVPGYTRWVVEWTKNANGRDTDHRHALYSIIAARRLTNSLLEMRPAGTSVQDVLTLVGFDEG
jgi:hypothetical protein